MQTPRTIWRFWASVLIVLTIGSMPRAQAPNRLKPFTAEEQRAIGAKLLGADQLVALAKGQRMRVLSVVPQEVDKDGAVATVALAVVVNYATGEAVRVSVDPATMALRAVEPLKGRPQSSPEERQEGRELVRKAPDLASIAATQSRIEGGFVVDAPAGQPAQGRYLEFHVVTPDGRAFLAEATVDLARGVVVVRRQEPGKEGAQ